MNGEGIVAPPVAGEDPTAKDNPAPDDAFQTAELNL
jgi:hypothetical protein